MVAANKLGISNDVNLFPPVIHVSDKHCTELGSPYKFRIFLTYIFIIQSDLSSLIGSRHLQIIPPLPELFHLNLWVGHWCVSWTVTIITAIIKLMVILLYTCVYVCVHVCVCACVGVCVYNFVRRLLYQVSE